MKGRGVEKGVTCVRSCVGMCPLWSSMLSVRKASPSSRVVLSCPSLCLCLHSCSTQYGSDREHTPAANSRRCSSVDPQRYITYDKHTGGESEGLEAIGKGIQEKGCVYDVGCVRTPVFQTQMSVCGQSLSLLLLKKCASEWVDVTKALLPASLRTPRSRKGSPNNSTPYTHTQHTSTNHHSIIRHMR